MARTLVHPWTHRRTGDRYRVVAAIVPVLLPLALCLGGCARRGGSPGDVLERFAAPAGWTRTELRAYDRENLFDLVDGQADTFFAYGLERVVVGRYQNATGAIVDASVWQLPAAADAFGLFTASRSGEPIGIGNDGDEDSGRRLAFWQGRCLVQIWSRQELPEAELQAFGRELAAALPGGGERPALLARLPEELRQQRGLIYFHQQLSIDSELWLGNENILGLSAATEGLLVRLPGDGEAAYLLLVQYPDAGAANAAGQALAAGSVEGCVVCRARGNLLAAVFGPVSKEEASEWLATTLGSG